MMPNNTLSAAAVVGGYLSPDINVVSRLRDYEDGGVGIQDTSQGSSGYLWECYFEADGAVMLRRDGIAPIRFFSQPRIVEITFAFDQNMRPNFAYELDDGTIELRWYDSLLPGYRTESFGAGRNPRLTMDDKRPEMVALSDVLFVYIRGDSLYYRQQRDRFQIERLLRTGVEKSSRLRNIGMTDNLRLYFEIV